MCLPCCCGFHEYDDVVFEGTPKRRKSKKKHGHAKWELVQGTPVIQTPYIPHPAPVYRPNQKGVIPSPVGPAPQPLVPAYMLVSNTPVSGMNYSPQVGCNLRGPQKHLYVPFRDTPWGPQPCPPLMADNNPAAPDPGAAPAPPPGPTMSGALPAGPNTNSHAYAYAYAGAGAGPPPGRPGPDCFPQNQFYYPNPNPPYPQGTNVNISVNGYGAGYYRTPQASVSMDDWHSIVIEIHADCLNPQYGTQPVHPPIPVQAANGQWLAGPYNRVPVGGYGAPPVGGPWAGPATQPVPMGPVGQAGSIWTGPTQGQHMQNLLLRADRRPVDMCPADPDPWRFYLVKEMDGGTTSRNRYTIDSGQIGKVVWYQSPDGSMYAVVVAPPEKEGDGDKKD